MANITLSVSDDIKKRMDNLPHMRWSEIARSAIVSKLELYETFENIAKKSKLTEKDAKMIGDSIKRSAYKRFMDEYNNRH